jgi:hypothetical protein
MRTTASLISSGCDGHHCRADVDGDKVHGGFDHDDYGKEDENKEDDDIDKYLTVAVALENQRARAMSEGGNRHCLMPSSLSTGPIKWKAGGGEEEDEGR